MAVWFSTRDVAAPVAATRSKANNICEYIGCSTQVVPSWSKVAIRSSGGTNLGLALSVVVLTKSRIACFAGPSFHEGNGSAATVAAGWLALEVAGVVLLLQPPSTRITERNDVERDAARIFIAPAPDSALR